MSVASPGGSAAKNPSVNAGDMGSITGSERSPRCNPLQYSCLENPMDREAWQLQSMGSQRVGHNLMTKQQQHIPRITDLSLFLSI